MSLTPGTRLGPYEIVTLLGSGGMGEVYRARDTRLKRDVAIKILPSGLTSSADRLARFEREAQLLAALNHPNIAHIHGVEDSQDHRALVMELVEGETLADRIARGPLPLDESLALTRQICEALQAAHDRGIVHRDLKPANIKIRRDGMVKILDFGIAKALNPANDGDSAASPTVSATQTATGTILGTAAYMSPEQARGKDVDRTADIWALGCVLYEMLTGGQAFGGETVPDSLANVLHANPDWGRLPRETPTAIRRVLRRCLERDSSRRLQNAVDARLDIDDALTGNRDSEQATGGVQPADRRPWTARVPWMIAFVAAGIAAWTAYAARTSSSRVRKAPAVQFGLALPAGMTLGRRLPAFALAPDGQAIVASVEDPARPGDTQHLALRRMNEAAFESIRGTERGSSPFFLENGTQIGFIDNRSYELKVVDLAGGTPRVVCALDAVSTAGVSAGPDGSIVFSQRTATGRFSLKRVSIAGGVPTVVAEPDPAKGESNFLWPDALPDGEHILLTVEGSPRGEALEVMSLKTGARRVVRTEGFAGRYVPAGYLLFYAAAGSSNPTSLGDLVAAPFDIRALETTGDAVPVLTGIRVTTLSGVSGIDVAVVNDALAVSPSRAEAFPRSSIAWLDRAGTVANIGETRAWRQPDLSPDGTRVAVGVDELNRDVWIYDIARDVASRFTSAPDEDETPRWSPDGTRLAWSGVRDGKRHLLIAPADGSAPEQRLWTLDNHMHVTNWSADGTAIYMNVDAASTGQDLWAYSFAQRTAQPFIQSKANEFGAAASPDGRWLAYVSDESGTAQVYVRRTEGSGYIQISRGGGTGPVWSRDGAELVFRNAEGSQFFSVAMSGTSELQPGSPRAIFSTGIALQRSGDRDVGYASSPDSKRFLILSAAKGTSASELQVTLNWLDGLKTQPTSR